MNWRDLVGLSLESATGAELALFAVFLISSRQRRSAALYLLAALAASLALLMAGNLVMGATGWPWLTDAVLFLDLLAPPLVYLYVRQIHYPAAPLRPLEGLHAAPACLGLLLWSGGFLFSMDIYVNACWFGYLALTAYYYVRHYHGYAPAGRQNFLAVLLAVLFAIGVLRLAIAFEAEKGSPYLEGTPYLLVLSALFLSTCRILFTALRYPDLLSVPGSNLKYASSTAGDMELDALDRRLASVLAERQPYLDPDLSLAEFAALLEAPPRHVSELINARYGMSFPAYMNLWRARTASTLLTAAPDKPIKIVMFEAGFRSKSIFNREFQRHFSLSPGEYRRQREQRAPPVG